MIKVISIVLICALLVVYLKSINSEMYFIALLGAGIIVLSISFEYVSQLFNFFNYLVDFTGIDKDFYLIIFKTVAIGYLVEFGAGTVTDMGLKSLADKLVFVGKLAIFSISLPILYAIFNLLLRLIQ
ncbi:MAG: hypothetical protein E7373_03500 [Clostridiales bacterium]|nr:hypothetical protein [Clostridiales bacterium]